MTPKKRRPACSTDASSRLRHSISHCTTCIPRTRPMIAWRFRIQFSKKFFCRSIPGKSIVVEALVTSAYLFNSVLDTSTATTLSVMKTFRLFFVLVFGISLFLFAADKPEEKLKPALDVITPDALLAHIKILSSDEFEGRAPGTKGEELSIKYISDQFRSIGLKPGNPDGSYFQEVPVG